MPQFPLTVVVLTPARAGKWTSDVSVHPDLKYLLPGPLHPSKSLLHPAREQVGDMAPQPGGGTQPWEGRMGLFPGLPHTFSVFKKNTAVPLIRFPFLLVALLQTRWFTR